ncbi:cytochrome P450 18a1 [Pararge aegeria]|uniref:Jg7368 protein n=4 Tax=Pararge aegeria TaxID=116150 RepID=A0A8S4RJT0_9NEOP|nr:cytochrome P450 18a1 [Pararge aegeria]CAH2237603.1 jg7368 [Pararge aegeria aegeria]
MITMLTNSKLLWALWQVVSYCSSRTSLPLLLTVGVTFLTMRLINLVRESRKLPPGPWSPPVVGYLPFLGVRHKTFLELAKSYGALFSTRLGNKLTIVLSDYKLIREAFRREEFTGRPSTPLMNILDGLGIINSEGRLWKNQRRFLHEKLREFGMTYMGNGKKIMEARIKSEVHELMENLQRSEGEAVDANPLLALGVSNVICGITMSVHFSHGDARFARLNHLIEEGMKLFGEIHYGEYIPLYNYLPGKAQVQEKVARNREEMFAFYQTLIDEHRNTLDMDNARDLIDVYLIEIEKAKMEGREGDLFEGRDHELQIKQILGDLFSAGMETIKSSLLWMIVFMLRNPDVKRRVQEELDNVIGRERLPTIEDMPNLPYTETTILETLRMSSIVPLATTHSPTKDVHLNGYRIPAGSQVVPLINCVHMDPNLWEEPNKFNPSRFIDENGKIKRPEFFMPFGVGRRMCLGDVLARMEMFMFFSSMMHQFDVESEAGAAPPSLEGTVGATIAPKAFRVKFVPRAPPAPPAVIAHDHQHLRHVGAH